MTIHDNPPMDITAIVISVLGGAVGGALVNSIFNLINSRAQHARDKALRLNEERKTRYERIWTLAGKVASGYWEGLWEIRDARIECRAVRRFENKFIFPSWTPTSEVIFNILLFAPQLTPKTELLATKAKEWSDLWMQASNLSQVEQGQKPYEELSVKTEEMEGICNDIQNEMIPLSKTLVSPKT